MENSTKNQPGIVFLEEQKSGGSCLKKITGENLPW